MSCRGLSLSFSTYRRWRPWSITAPRVSKAFWLISIGERESFMICVFRLPPFLNRLTGQLRPEELFTGFLPIPSNRTSRLKLCGSLPVSAEHRRM